MENDEIKIHITAISYFLLWITINAFVIFALFCITTLGNIGCTSAIAFFGAKRIFFQIALNFFVLANILLSVGYNNKDNLINYLKWLTQKGN